MPYEESAGGRRSMCRCEDSGGCKCFQAMMWVHRINCNDISGSRSLRAMTQSAVGSLNGAIMPA